MKKETDSNTPRTLTGIVVSNKMKDTVVVEVNRLVKHPKYRKYLKRSVRFKADDKGNTKKEGDKVEIVACRPVSRDKHFRIV